MINIQWLRLIIRVYRYQITVLINGRGRGRGVIRKAFCPCIDPTLHPIIDKASSNIVVVHVSLVCSAQSGVKIVVISSRVHYYYSTGCKVSVLLLLLLLLLFLAN